MLDGLNMWLPPTLIINFEAVAITAASIYGHKKLAFKSIVIENAVINALFKSRESDLYALRNKYCEPHEAHIVTNKTVRSEPKLLKKN